MSKIDPDVLVVLSSSRIDHTSVFLPEGQLDRKLYVRVDKVLKELGGAWNRKSKAHVFANDPTDLFETVLNTGELTTAADLGFFATPPELARELVQRAGIHKGELVLEPSAGEGAIVEALHDAGATVHAIEIDEKRYRSMRATSLGQGPHHFVCEDFLEYAKCELDIFDACVMNPPFARQQDLTHVEAAFRLVKPGGRLVSVLGAGILFRENKRSREFRAWVSANGGAIEKLPDDSFKTSGTRVRTVALEMRKAK